MGHLLVLAYQQNLKKEWAKMTPTPDHQSLAPTTTTQEDITTAGQRKVNLVWEYTQAAVAITVVGANVLVWVITTVKGAAAPIPEGLTNALFLIVGFYFSRTNHSAIGGIGYKPSEGPFSRR